MLAPEPVQDGPAERTHFKEIKTEKNKISQDSGVCQYPNLTPDEIQNLILRSSSAADYAETLPQLEKQGFTGDGDC